MRNVVVNHTPKYIVTATITALMLSACGGQQKYTSSEETQKNAIVQPVQTQMANGETVQMLLPDFAKLVEQTGASVVNIRAEKEIDIKKSNDNDDSDELEQFADDPFYDFFKRLVPDSPEIESPNDGQNFGSGFIISADGYIITNAHVIRNLERIKVTLNDKREYIAKLIGADKQSDIALLKIEANNLPMVKIGDAKALKAGEWVAAIGAPFGFDSSVTAGIVSAKGRSLPNENYTPFIQTDVAINPGNSGGPLFNLKGEVVGVNSQIYSRSGGFMGISFAIPIEVAMNVADQLKETGKVQRGQLGVMIQEVSYDLAKSFGLDKPTGALIAKVMPDGPAIKAGLQVGDIIRTVNGEEIHSSSELPVVIGGTAPGKEIKLGIWRKGEQIEKIVTLGKVEEKNELAMDKDEDASKERMGSQSFKIEDLGLSLSAQSNDNEKRIVVTASEGIATQAGLRRGDLILAIGQIQVSDEKTFRQALAEASNPVPLLVERNGNTLFLALTRPE